MGQAYIREVWHSMPLHRSYATYEWDGDPKAPVLISWRLLRRGNLSVLPWRLLFVRDRFDYGAAEYIRADGWYLPIAAVQVGLARVCGWLMPFWARVILTLYIWGLADCTDYETISSSQLLRPQRRWWAKFLEGLG